MRKEYNDRWNAPLVNPGFTWGEYENGKIIDKGARDYQCYCHVYGVEYDMYGRPRIVHTVNCNIAKRES